MFETERENGSRDRKICSILGKVRDREVRNKERLCSVLGGEFQEIEHFIRDIEIFEIEGSRDRESPL